MKKDCKDCIHSTTARTPACKHPNNLRPDLFGDNAIFWMCDSHRGFSGEDEDRMPNVCGKSGRWFEDGE